MQSRYALAACALGLLAVIVPTQQAPPTGRQGNGYSAEFMNCLKEADEHCKGQLKTSLNNYIRCAYEYLKASGERCQQVLSCANGSKNCQLINAESMPYPAQEYPIGMPGGGPREQ